MEMYQKKEWGVRPLSEVVRICDSLRKPVNNTERQNRIANKSVDKLFPYFGATGQVGFIDDYIIDGEYVLLGEDGAPFLDGFATKAYIINGKAWVNNHAHILKSNYNNKFLCYYLNNFNYKEYVSGTTRLKLTQASMMKIPIPVPPLAEQERLVAKIEELFSELDSAVSELKNVKEKLQIYRQAVLKEAFEDLNRTEKIRNVSQFVTSGSRGWAKYYSDKGAKFIRIGNLSHTSIDINLEEIQYVTLPQKTEGTRSLLSPNDVLVSITADLGAIALVPENLGEAYINQHIAMIRFSTPELGKFFAWYLQSDYGQKQLLKNRRGNGKLGLGLDDIRDSEVPIITESKAHIIVDKIEQQLSQCNSIDQTVNNMLLKTAALRQSILKQAFEGKL